jgi:phage shock protein A
MSDSPSSIDIGAFIVAIGALVASTITFVLTYSRARKSDQIKIARDHLDRLDKKNENLEEGFTTLLDKISKARAGALPAEQPPVSTRLEKYLEELDDIMHEIDYFDHLVTSHEVVDKNVLSYSAPSMTKTLQELITKLDNVQKEKEVLNQLGVSNEAFTKVQEMSTKLNDKSKIWKRRDS